MATEMVERLVAVEGARAQELPILGHLTWYTVRECLVPVDAAQAALTAAGLPLDLLPRLNDRDCYRRMCNWADRQVRRHPLSPGRFVNVMVRHVRSSWQHRELVSHVVLEEVDARDERLSFETVAVLRLDEHGHLRIERVHQGSLPDPVTALLADLRPTYERMRAHYDGGHIRQAVYQALQACDPVNVRPSGGVWFVPRPYAPTLQAVATFLAALTPYNATGQPSRLWHVPVLDGEEHRLMVREALEEQAEEEARRAVEDMAALLRAARIRRSELGSCVERVQRLREVIGTYESLLEQRIEAARAALEIAQRQLQALLERAADQGVES